MRIQILILGFKGFKGQVHGSAHAQPSKCCFPSGHALIYGRCKQYDHVITLSKNQSAHSPGSHLHLINLNIYK